DWEMSLEMAKAAVDEGITHILATPHHMNRHWMNPKSDVLLLVNEFQERIDSENIPLTIFPGQEVRLHGEILQNIQKDEICFIDEMQSAGITPIIVHPERNHAILKDPSILYEFVSRDILAQLTAASYLGLFGKEIEKLSTQLIEHNLVHFLASDAHNVTSRKFYMKEAFRKLEKEYGKEKVRAFDQVTRDLVNGDPIYIPESKIIKKKKFFGLL